MSATPEKTEKLLRRDDPKKTVLLAAPVKLEAAEPETQQPEEKKT